MTAHIENGRDSYEGRPPQEVPMDFHLPRKRVDEGEVLPVDPREVAAAGSQWPAHCRPETMLQALMEAPPFEEPDRSIEEGIALSDALAEAVDGLSHPYRYIVEQVVIAKRSLRGFTHEEVYGIDTPHPKRLIPKTTIARWRDKGLDMLREQLTDEPAVKTRLAEIEETRPSNPAR